MKRCLSIFLSLSLILSIFTVSDFSAFADNTNGNFSYSVNDSGVTITRCNDYNSTEIIIPSEIDGYPVTEIGDSTFRGCTNLTSVKIPDSVTSIDDSAFYGCSSLTSVTIPNGVTSIGDSTFYGCTSLKSVTIPNSVTSIGDSAFYGCSSLKSAAIPDSVTSIGNYAFYDCNSLTSVTIPNSVTSIECGAFYSERKNLTVYYLGNVVDWNNINISQYDNFGDDCYAFPCEFTLYLNDKKVTDLVIPEGVTSISCNLRGVKSLTSVTIPDGVETIGDKAFYDCRKLTEITLPKSVKSVGRGAFDNCINLNKVRVLNPDCSIFFDFDCDGMPFPKCATIYGYSGSTAEVFAKNNGYNFLDMTKNCYHHSYKLTETKPSTCTRSGYKKYTCTVCNDSYTESLPLVPHRYENKKKKAGIGTNGYVSDECTVCGDVESKSVIYGVNRITLGSTTYSYTGKSQKPSVTVKDSKGKTVPASSYTVSYSKDTKSVGKHSVKITLKGNYTGSKTLHYTIIPKNTSLSKLTAGKKSFTVTLKKYTTQTTGYQIQYSTSSNFKGAKTVTLSNKTTAKKVKGLKSKKKYYVRVRTYKTVDGKKYCSKWSKAKTVKTK